jgi:hypothetical protein
MNALFCLDYSFMECVSEDAFQIWNFSFLPCHVAETVAVSRKNMYLDTEQYLHSYSLGLNKFAHDTM